MNRLLRRATLRSLLVLVALAAATSCRSGGSVEGDSRGIIVVNAPAEGIVRRVPAREGMTVQEGTPIVEIAVPTEAAPTATQTPGESAETRAARDIKAADAEIEAARAEAVRHEAEVQRLTPLVANNEASAAQLEGERALFERAQQRLQRAQDAKRNAEGGLITARQPGQNQPGVAGGVPPPPPPPREKIVAATASSAGTVSVVSVRVGDRVKAGQPLATIRAGD